MPVPHNHHSPNIINIAGNRTPYGLYLRCSVARPFICLPAHGQLSGFHKAAVEAILLHQLLMGATPNDFAAGEMPTAPPQPFPITACPSLAARSAYHLPWIIFHILLLATQLKKSTLIFFCDAFYGILKCFGDSFPRIFHKQHFAPG